MIQKVIEIYYLNFCYWFALCKVIEIFVVWVLHDFPSYNGALIAFKNTICVSGLFVLGLLIDADNSKIYLTLCTPMVLEIIGTALLIYSRKTFTVGKYIELIIIRNKF